jgi:hypothetical protein
MSFLYDNLISHHAAKIKESMDYKEVINARLYNMLIVRSALLSQDLYELDKLREELKSVFYDPNSLHYGDKYELKELRDKIETSKACVKLNQARLGFVLDEIVLVTL